MRYSLRRSVCIVTASVGFILARPAFAENYVTPTEKVPLAQWPFFTDDLNFKGIKTVISRQLQRFGTVDFQGTIQYGQDQYPLVKVRDSLVEFLSIIENYKACPESNGTECINWLNAELRKKFVLYRPHLEPGDPHYGEADPAFFTAYYTPRMTVSKTRTGIYQHGIYSLPADENLRHLSRDQIDFHGALENKGLDLFYGSDLFNLYLLQVEGGGHMLVKTGDQVQSQYISYAGQNGLPFRFIVTYMLKKGWITSESIDAQRRFLNAHPELQEQIYSTCPAYVFYQLSNTPPVGCEGVVLTDNRSLATDLSYYRFKGGLSFVSSSRPVDKPVAAADDNRPFKAFSRFYLDQDTGGAIRGKARADLYFGEGAYAEYASYNEAERGDIYFLMLK